MNNTSSRDFVVPSDNDVLCGRGRVAFRSPGNVYLRALIVGSLEDYVRSSRCEKTKVIRRIICSIMEHKGSRFLQYDKVAGQWYDGGIAAAKNRVGAAFRDAATPGKVKCIEKLKRALLQQNLVDSNRLVQKEAASNSSCTEELVRQNSYLLPQNRHPKNSQNHDSCVDIGAVKLKTALQSKNSRAATGASVVIALEPAVLDDDRPGNDLIRKVVFFNATQDSSMGPDALVRRISAYDESLDAMEASFKSENELLEDPATGPRSCQKK